MVPASFVRECIDTCLAEHAAAAGVGPDAYHEQHLVHPMAEGKLLQVLASLRRTGLLSQGEFEARALKSVDRLQSLALRQGTGVCWGLGFTWKRMPASEPFLITSAIVVRGLLDCERQGAASARISGLLGEGRNALAWWNENRVAPDKAGGIRLPAYSPSVDQPIYNAAAYASSTLCLLGVPGTEATLAAISSRRVPALGWTYSPDNPVVDLVHQCYILNSIGDVFGAEKIAAPARDVIGQFAGPCCFFDAMQVMDAEAAQPERKAELAWVRSVGFSKVDVKPRPARLWSLGELLVVVSRLSGLQEDDGEWVGLGHRIVDMLIRQLQDSDNAESRFPRHVMHAVHGLACFLAVLRSRAQAARAAPGVQ